jgi:hypothetical protein
VLRLWCGVASPAERWVVGGDRAQSGMRSGVWGAQVGPWGAWEAAAAEVVGAMCRVP